ncbi:MAG: hypothetical protein EA427_07885 [Spirochaetaceae bacterium]|nr:MAG: hypothetical protein EA427_07885 [Spirochaetaceae bacterium]
MKFDSEYRRIFERLTTEVLPFWFEEGLDRVEGGFFACFDGITGERVADHKFLWVQGRLLWLFSRLHRFLEDTLRSEDGAAKGSSPADYALLLRVDEAACSLYRFITRYGIDADKRVRFVVTREGKPSNLRALGLGDNDDPRASTYSDCFVLMGMAAYGHAFDVPEATAVAQGILERTIGDLRRGAFKTHPYPEPPGMEALGSRMILAMAAGELRPRAVAETFILDTFRDLRDRFLRPDGSFRELVPRKSAAEPAGAQPPSSALLRYANPGHTLETYGLLGDHVDLAGQAGWTGPMLVEGIMSTLHAAWDSVNGGLLTFIGPGTKPDSTSGIEELFQCDDPLSGESLFSTVRNDWSLKLWWPHVEGMYATLALAMEMDNDVLLEWYLRLRDYTFRVFPDPAGREWLHIRDRRGQPLRRVVALPIKDPYHIARCLLKMLILLK